MRTTVFCVTILCLELASSHPFPELPSNYGSHEPVGVPDQRVIAQPIQISNLARSQNSELAYQQQQLAYLQQENIRRQNYENLLRKQEQQQDALKQQLGRRLAVQSPENNYNSQIPLATVHEPYINSVPLQRPITSHYEAPIRKQYYQNQQFREPHQRVESPKQYNMPNTEHQAVAEPVSGSSNQKLQPVSQYNTQNVSHNPQIKQALASTVFKKRYLVIYPNGTKEHVDKIDKIVERYPNHILLNGGELPKPNKSISNQANPQPPVAPVASTAQAMVGTVSPLAPSTPSSPVLPPSTPNVSPLSQPFPATPTPTSALLSPNIPNGSIPGLKPAQPPTGPTTSTKLRTNLAPTSIVTAATAINPPIKESVVTARGAVTTGNPALYPPPTGPVITTPISAVTTANSPITAPSAVTTTTTTVAPSDPLISNTPAAANITVSPAALVNATAKEVTSQSPEAKTAALTDDNTSVNQSDAPISPSAVTNTTTTVPPSDPVMTNTPAALNETVTSEPVVNDATIDVTSQLPEATNATLTDIKTPVNQPDANSTVTTPSAVTNTTSTVPPSDSVMTNTPAASNVTVTSEPLVNDTAIDVTSLLPEATNATLTEVNTPVNQPDANSTVTTPSAVTNTTSTVPPSDPVMTNTPAASNVTVTSEPLVNDTAIDVTSLLPEATNATLTEVNTPVNQLDANSTVTTPSAVTNTTTTAPPSDHDMTKTPAASNVTVTSEPVVNDTTIDATSQLPEATSATLTDVPTPVNESDAVANTPCEDMCATVCEPVDPSTPDFPFAKPPVEPVVWFRTTDLDFWDKLTSGNETYDVVYFFNIVHEPRLVKNTKTVIFPNGTTIEEVTETIYDDEDEHPRIIKTTEVTNPDDT